MCGNKNYQRKFDEKLKERFFNTYKFSGHDNSKCILLHKGVYQYEYMFDWEKFSEKLFPEKEDFYSCLNMENVKKHRDIKLAITERRRNYLVSESNYATKFFTKKIIRNRNKKKATDTYE